MIGSFSATAGLLF